MIAAKYSYFTQSHLADGVHSLIRPFFSKICYYASRKKQVIFAALITEEEAPWCIKVIQLAPLTHIGCIMLIYLLFIFNITIPFSTLEAAQILDPILTSQSALVFA